MNRFHINNYEYAATEFAKETKINNEKREFFLEGVKWAFDAIEATIANSNHPMASESDNAKMMDWTLRDLKRAIKELRKPHKDKP